MVHRRPKGLLALRELDLADDMALRIGPSPRLIRTPADRDAEVERLRELWRIYGPDLVAARGHHSMRDSWATERFGDPAAPHRPSGPNGSEGAARRSSSPSGPGPGPAG